MANEATTQQELVPVVTDYEMIRCVGSGAFGDVWLAQAKATRRFRAIKIVCRSRFPRARIYETEFTGLRKFEEISREDAGFIDILHISRNDETGCFSYVMELADDLESGQIFDPQTYVPKTLSNELARRKRTNPDGIGRLTPAECVQVALNITAALSALHQNRLVHRDIKPSNIVFVRGLAKLADVGLVTDLKQEPDQGTLIGSPPFMDQQVHGTPLGDLFAFGKVLYMMATGRSPTEWPAPPSDLERIEDRYTFDELMEISRKACDPERSLRYRNAEDIHSELLVLRVGHSIRRLKRLEQIAGTVKRFAIFALLLAGLVSLALFQAAEHRKQVAELRQHKVGSAVAYGTRALDENDLLGALPWFAEALRQDQDNPRTEPAHRLRLGTLLQQCPTIVQMWFRDHPFNSAQFAGQDNQVLLPTSDRRWAIHDLATGRTLYAPFGDPGRGRIVSISAPAGLAVSSNTDRTNTVTVWNVLTGLPVAGLVSATPMSEAAISSDGRWVAAASGTNSIIIWNLTNREQVKELAGHTGPIISLAFSSDGRYLVTAGGDSTAIVWDLASGRSITRFTNHTHWIYCVRFSPDGRWVASASFDRSVRVWETETGHEVLPPLQHGDGVSSVEFSSDSARLVTAGLDFSVRVWDARTGHVQHQLRHNSKPLHAGFSPSGRYIVTACFDGIARVWALPPGGFTPNSSSTVYSGDGASSALLTNQAIKLLNPDTGQTVGSLLVPDLRVIQVRLSSDGGRVLTLAEPPPASDPNSIQAVLWDRQTGARIGRPLILDRAIPNLVLSPTGDQIFAYRQGRITVWDFVRDRELLSLPCLDQRAAFDPSGDRLAVAVDDQAQIWNLATAQPILRTPRMHQAWVDTLEWSPDGKYLLTACWNRSFDAEFAQVWDPATGATVGAPLSHRDGVRFATFSPDGKKAVTCGEDFTAMLWDWRTGLQLTPPLRHNDQVTHAAFSPDNRWLATACRGGAARVWDAETGEPITPDLRHPEDVVKVRWVAHGRSLLTRTESGQTRLWPLSPDSRPLRQLVQIAELLSAERIHSTESTMPETKEGLQKLWNDLRSGYPQEFSLPLQ